jgi:hypothetical protein
MIASVRRRDQSGDARAAPESTMIDGRDTLDDWRSVICRTRGDAADERLEHFIESLRMAGWR